MYLKKYDLKGRLAVVTGGGQAIGLACVEALSEAGAKVVIADYNAKVAESGRDAMKAKGYDCDIAVVDVTDSKGIEALAGKLGKVDILVNNAGIAIRKQPEDYTLAEWNKVIDTNLTGTFLCARAAHPHMKKAGGGKILNIGSMLSIFGASFAAPYAASKGGTVQVTKALACAWAKDNIQVNAILPGWIDTQLTQAARQEVPGLNERVLARTPAGRWGEPHDFTGIAVFLASAASDFITGAAIPVDGGYSSQG